MAALFFCCALAKAALGASEIETPAPMDARGIVPPITTDWQSVCGCPPISYSQFESLRMGSTYEEAVAILGCEGREMSRFEVPGYPQFSSVLYTWDTGKFASSVTAMFQGNRMISRSQFGLK